MNYKPRTSRAFTLIELVVSIAILVMMISFAAVIFKVSINSHRTAMANTEIMQKLRAITDQLNADFKDMRKDGVIFVAWKAVYDNNLNRHVRFDTILFFTNGDFQSYRSHSGKIVRGNIARVCYMLAKDGFGVRAWGQKREQRILARSQHILTADIGLVPPFPDLATIPIPFTPADNAIYEAANNLYEYDRESLASWRRGAPQPGLFRDKLREMLTVCADVQFGGGTAVSGGLTVSTSDPNTLHMLLCESVGELKIQGWYEAERRWFPKVDPDYNGDLSDSDFFTVGGAIDPSRRPSIVYPRWNFECGNIGIGNNGILPPALLNESNFNFIPGLGRALKFTFTLYDSKGIIKGGRTFTHIVYLGD
ncbi:MAG: prepilin-type N-terminal cleavage/methylation domain-containing protein [Planctomycetota bacterium]|jgi:prepilin-type N-terminal cleavage/methylation domain-containing protein